MSGSVRQFFLAAVPAVWMSVVLVAPVHGQRAKPPAPDRRPTSVLTALMASHELEIHLGAALNHGVTREEIEEVMIMMVLYGGFPRAIDGLNLARKVFAARETSS